MTVPEAELRAYYEEESRLRLREGRSGARLSLRRGFIEQLQREGRRSVLDIGAGPGVDLGAFHGAGLHAMGVDLALGNARLAAEAGLVMIQGSATALPVRPASFDAAWSISTLMHLDHAEAANAAAEVARCLRPGGRFLAGIWGRETESTVVDDTKLPGNRRPFHLRSVESNTSLLTSHPGLELETNERWPSVSEDWDYQVFHLRSR